MASSHLPDLAGLFAHHIDRLQAGYADALAATHWDAVVIHAGSPLPRSLFDDQFWPLRPVPHFAHWLPLAEADAALLIRPGQTPTLLRLDAWSFWESAPTLDAPHIWPHVAIVPIGRVDDVRDHLPAGRVAWVGEDRTRAVLWGLPEDAVNPRDLVLALDQLRVRKSAYEVACLTEANRRAALGHNALRDTFRHEDASELDLHLAYLKATGQDDPETPYKNIVAAGANAATLHHIAYGRQPTRQASLLVDAGATYLGYASDITRTWVRGSGAVVDTFAALVAGVERLQLDLCAQVAVGLPYEALHEAAHQAITALLADIGVFRTTVDTAWQADLSRTFLPHGLGHSLGLQCHDVGCALRPPARPGSVLRNTSTIAAGQVFTIEPGIYFIPRLLQPLREGPHRTLIDWTLVDALTPLGGVRIEDDLEVLDHGVRNLTRDLLPVGGGR